MSAHSLVEQPKTEKIKPSISWTKDKHSNDLGVPPTKNLSHSVSRSDSVSHSRSDLILFLALIPFLILDLLSFCFFALFLALVPFLALILFFALIFALILFPALFLRCGFSIAILNAGIPIEK